MTFLNEDDPTQCYLLSKRYRDVPLSMSFGLERDNTSYSPKTLGLFRTLILTGLVNGVALHLWKYHRALNSC